MNDLERVRAHARSSSRRSFLLGCASLAAAVYFRTAPDGVMRDSTVGQGDAREVAGGARGAQLNSNYSFENFRVDPSNRFAHAAAFAVAEAPARAYNPLLMYGTVGSGKTHLLHAIGNRVANLHPHLRIRYRTTAEFTNELINAVRNDRIASFHRSYRQVDLLMVDDTQLLASKEWAQEEFRHVFNALHDSAGQLVISSNGVPEQMAGFDDWLRSRFEWGLMTEIKPLSLSRRGLLFHENEPVKPGAAPCGW